ncbi:MAG: thymidine kinase [Alphaproteobacteria bacterium]|nr:thymidine kinase [Alphaproteobacteria bacterium]
MAKIHFYYGVMGSSKSAELGINAFNFDRTGNKWIAIKPTTDDRDSKTDIVSRIGVKTKAMALKNLDNFKPKRGTQFILVDEVQFFSPADIDKLVYIADHSKITVVCYGLMIDSNQNIFPASKHLVEVGAELHRMDSVCEMDKCTRLATHHIRFDKDKNVIRGGQQVEVGASQYMSVCRKHFNMLYGGEMELEK